MIDNIEPLSFVIIMLTIAATWAVVRIRDRRVLARRAALVADAIERVESWADAGACAIAWIEGESINVCTRPHEHTGPHADQITKALVR
ncbi:hypothetical protein [uncultured Microbacterium sp.]|uniref:hypothetical protein n=1 Tax=uncultured Microbacterium sp. TaxID=191216 RepID=UPI002610833A|nr:hypothetical protein [uncultured Microbacterium sp.]